MTKNLYIGFGIAVAVLVAVFFIFKSPGDIKNYPPKDGPIVAFGDSLVSGSGSTEGNDFVSILSRKIGEPIINMGVSGDTTAEALARVASVIEKKPRIVIVLLGGNDFLRKVSRDTTFTNLQSIIAQIQASGSIVVLLGVRDGLIWSGSAEFKDLANETQSAYVPDVLDGLFGNSTYMSDSIHPNSAGYALIANKVYPVLRDLLR